MSSIYLLKKRSPSNKNKHCHIIFMSETFNDIYITRKFAMKKNILVVQSLLLLPLVTSSLSFAMDKPSAMQKKQAKVQNQRKKPLPTPREKAEKRQNAQAQKLNYKDVVINTMSDKEKKNYLQRKEEETKQNSHNLMEELKVSIAFREKTDQIDKMLASMKITTPPTSISSSETNISNELDNIDYKEFPFFESSSCSTSSSSATTSTESSSISQSSELKETSSIIQASVMLPTEEKSLGLQGNFTYYTQNTVSGIISLLIKKNFDIQNASYFNWLNEAIQNAVENGHYGSLITIAAICQNNEEYKNSIRISDDSAEKSFNLFEVHHKAEVNNLNKILEEKQKNSILEYNNKTIAFAKFISEATDRYNKDIQNITDNYNAEIEKANKQIALTKSQISTFSALNKSTRKKIINLVDGSTITIPKNKCMSKKEKRENSLAQLLDISNSLPTIKEPQTKLALLTDK